MAGGAYCSEKLIYRLKISKQIGVHLHVTSRKKQTLTKKKQQHERQADEDRGIF